MIQIRQPLRLITGAIIAFGLWNYLQWPQAYWIVISTLTGLHVSNTSQLRRKHLFLISTGIIAAITACIANILTPYIFLLAIFLFFTTFCSINVGLLWPFIWGGAFIANYYANLSSVSATGLQEGEQRVASILLGFLIAISLYILFFPNRLRNEVILRLVDALDELGQLSESIFTCYLAADYPKNSFFYDQQLHVRRRNYLCVIHGARLLIDKMKLPAQAEFKKILEDVERCYEITLSLGTLNYRVTDHATFEVAYKELSQLSKSIFAAVRIIRARLLDRKSAHLSDALKENIYQLEDVNRSALNVVARDPMVFLIFIQDLYKLDEMFATLSTDISAARDGK